MEASLKDFPFLGFWYKRSALDHSHFDPQVANIQLEYLLMHGIILSDEEALPLAEDNKDEKPEQYLEKVLESYGWDHLRPNI